MRQRPRPPRPPATCPAPVTRRAGVTPLTLLLLLGWTLLGWTAPAAPAAVAQPAGGELRVDGVDLDDAPRITVRVVAPPDLLGRDLGAQDFSLLVDGEPQPVDVRTARADDVEVVLAFDVSGSMQGEPLDAAKEAAIAFIERMPPSARVAVLSFGDAAEIAQPFTTDLDAATQAVDSLQAAGETALYDALEQAAELVAGSDAARRAVVVVSDGGDTVSTADQEAAAGAVVGSTARFFAVALESPEQDLEVLTGLADASGGAVAQASDPGALDEAYARVAANLVDVYEVTATTSATGATDLTLALQGDDAVYTAQQRVFLRGAPVAPGESVVAVPEPRPGVVVTPGLLERPPALWAAIAATVVGVAAALVLVAPRRRALRPKGMSARESLSDSADRVVAVTDAALQRLDRRQRLDAFLEPAGIAMRTGEYVTLVAAAVVVAALTGLALSGPTGALLLGVIPLAAARVLPVVLADRRRSAFADALSDTLQLLAGSLRAGYGLSQAIDAVARESAPPTRDEFTRVLAEVRLGRNMNDALRALAQRMASPDFSWVVQAIEIHRDVGGDLSAVLDTVSGTIRERNQLQRQVKALSAEGRLSGIILVVLPVLLAGVLAVTSPDYLAELVSSTVGLVLLSAGAVLLLVGAFWISRVTRLRY